MDNIFEQLTQITKANAYDIVVPELIAENDKLKKRVKYLEGLINEYTLKMKANLSGGKVDEFLKDQVNDIPAQLFQQSKNGKEIDKGIESELIN